MKKIVFLFAVISLSLLAVSSKAESLTVNADTLKKGKGYILFSKPENMMTVTFSQNKKKENLVYIRLGYPKPLGSSNVVNGTVYQSNRKYKDDDVLPGIDKVEILSGKYEEMKSDKETPLRNLFTLSGVVFPLHLILTSGKDIIELELTEAAQWNIGIDLKPLN